MNRTNIYLTDEQVARLEAQADYMGVSRAEVIRRAIDQYLYSLEDDLNRVTERFAPAPRIGSQASTEKEVGSDPVKRIEALECAVARLTLRLEELSK